MDQPPLTKPVVRDSGTALIPIPIPLPILSASSAERVGKDDCVVIVRNLEEFQQWLREATTAVQWIQVEGLLDQPTAWTDAARVKSDVALDVVMSDPLAEYPMLYRLVDVSNTRAVRVTIPVRKGFLKALRLASALHLPARLLPTQPDEEELQELMEAVDFYLHDPMVEAPIEFFHSVIGWRIGETPTDLWLALERDPAVFPHFDEAGNPVLPSQRAEVLANAFVKDHVDRLERDKSECLTCAWNGFCRGYFKLPDPAYSCEGVIKALDQLGAAASEIAAEIGEPEPQPENQPPLYNV